MLAWWSGRAATALMAHRRLVYHWLPLLVYMAAIFAVSSLPAAAIEEAAPAEGVLPFFINEATVHTGEFAVLAVLLYRLLSSYGVTSPAIWAVGLVLTAAYGASDEIHQSFVPGRDPSWQDVGYDSLGALLGLLASELLVRFRRRTKRAGR